MSKLPVEPTRARHDWDNSMMGECGSCGNRKSLVKVDGVYSCASCIDSGHQAEWRDYARQLRNLILATPETQDTKQVQVFKYERTGGSIMSNRKVPDYIAKFHQFGVHYEEFESGPGNYSVAIVEKDDGTVAVVEASMIQFINNPEGAA